MVSVEIKKVQDFPTAIFKVELKGQTLTSPKVTLKENYYQKLRGWKITPQELLGKSFNFLLEREPNTLIL